jgi:hypothetical protein
MKEQTDSANRTLIQTQIDDITEIQARKLASQKRVVLSSWVRGLIYAEIDRSFVKAWVIKKGSSPEQLCGQCSKPHTFLLERTDDPITPTHNGFWLYYPNKFKPVPLSYFLDETAIDAPRRWWRYPDEYQFFLASSSLWDIDFTLEHYDTKKILVKLHKGDKS